MSSVTEVTSANLTVLRPGFGGVHGGVEAVGGQKAWERRIGAPAGGSGSQHYSADEGDQQDQGKPGAPTSARLGTHN